MGLQVRSYRDQSAFSALALLSPHHLHVLGYLEHWVLRNWITQTSECRFAHIFHAVVCVLLVWVAVSRTPEFSLTDGPDTATARQNVLLATNVYSSSTFMFSIGYFLADTFMMLTVLPNSAMMVHHLSAGISLVGSLITGCCHFYGLLLLSTEVTTPLICLRWLLDKSQRKGTQLYLINAVCIVITWVFSRILLFVYLFLHMWEYRDVLDSFALIVKVGLCRFVSHVNCFAFPCPVT